MRHRPFPPPSIWQRGHRSVVRPQPFQAWPISFKPTSKTWEERLEHILAKLFPRRRVKIYNHRPRPQANEMMLAYLVLGFEKISAWTAIAPPHRMRVLGHVAILGSILLGAIVGILAGVW